MEVAVDIGVRSTNQRRSFSSEDDNESIHSVQEKETDVVQDSHSEEYDDFSSVSTLELEYEVATSDSDDATAAPYEVLLGTGADGVSSSGDDDMHVTAAIAAVLCDTSLEAWATDCGEDSDTTAYNDSLSSAASNSGRGADFWTCLQCNGRNDQPKVRYCDKCFQRCWQCKTRKNYNCFPLCNDCYKARKNLFPPRPRGARKRKLERQATEAAQVSHKRRASNSCDEPPVKLTTLQRCLSGLSQDSGVGSSQEIPRLNFDKIVMPVQAERGTKRTRSIESDIDTLNSCNSDADHCPASKKARLLSTVIVNNVTDIKNLPSTSNTVIVNTAIVDIACDYIDRTDSVVGAIDKSLDTSHAKSLNITSLKTRSVSDTDLAVASSSKITANLKQSHATSELDSAEQSDVATSSKDGNLKNKARQSISDLGSVDICPKEVPNVGPLPELKELCIICNNNPKNAIFLHGKIAHLCACYKCAMKTWRITKRCPMCNCKVKNIVKVYST